MSRGALNTVLMLLILSSLTYMWRPVAIAVADSAGESQSLEYRVRAGFILNFLRLTEFPKPTSESELFLCIWSDEPHQRAFSLIAGKNIQGKKLVVSEEGSSRCDAVYYDALHAAVSWESVPRLQQALIIGNGSDFCSGGGGHICFFKASNNIRFVINRSAAEASGIRFSSKLLGLAKIINDS